MAKVIAQRMTAHVEGEFVVFLIGMRVNRFWKIHKWLPVALAMPRMLRELSADATSGFLALNHGSAPRTPIASTGQPGPRSIVPWAAAVM